MEITETSGTIRTPVHLWIVGALGLILNGFACFEYVMTRTRGAAYVQQTMPDVDAPAYMDYINGFPIWASFGWGLGVWAGLAGSILLLMRHRLAVPALALSFIGALLGLGYQILYPSGVAGMNPTLSQVAPIAVLIFVLFLFLYARAMRAKGVLR